MYQAVLTLHSLLRWAVVVAGVVAVVRCWSGGKGGGLPFTVLFDVQFLVGLMLYLLLSPLTLNAWRAGTAMSNGVLRFWAVEHPFGMIAALALAHVGRARSRGDATGRRAAVYYTLALVIVLLATPWPFLPYGRPLF